MTTQSRCRPYRKFRPMVPSVGVAAAASACAIQPAAQQLVDAGSVVSVSVEQVNDQAFCDGGRQAGISNAANNKVDGHCERRP